MKVLLVVYDNESYTHYFPQGLASIAAVIEKSGNEVEIYNQDINHWPEEHLTNYLDKSNFDIVGVSVIAGYFQYRKLLSISNSINRSKNRPLYILGGHGPSPEPEFFLKKTQADVAVIGEGEVTIIELIDAFANHKSFSDIEGIAYLEGTKVVLNPRRPLIQDLNKIPMPAYHLFPMKNYRLMRQPCCTHKDFALPILSGRGCTFKCNFCYRMDEGFRARDNESIIQEIIFLKKNYGITYISFSDELLMSSEKRTISLCDDLIKAKLNIKWYCNGRLNYAKLNVLKKMKEAGCVFINYGIEAFDDTILRNMNKSLTVKQIVKGIESTLQEKISPGFNILFGNIGENAETLKKGVEFLLKYDDCSQMRTIRPVTPYPGSDLYYYAIERGLLEDCEDFYENKHINADLPAVNFTNMDDDAFLRALMEANKSLIANYFSKKLDLSNIEVEELYLGKDTGFRGFRHF